MKKKLLGLFVCMLLMISAVPVVESLKNSAIDGTIPNTPLACMVESWPEIQKSLNSDGTDMDFFDCSVSPDGDTALLGEFGGENQKGSVCVFTKESANQPPVFGTPNPGNGSTNNSLSLSWIIPINDSDEDAFSWTIQCSNGQTASGTGASNGTKSLSLSGLVYLTTYKVWVNATDPTGSGLYTRKWYTFGTKVSLPPVFGTPSSVNGSINNPLSFNWSIPINDPEGDVFSWTIQCRNGQTTSGTGAWNGTKLLELSGLKNSTTYKVWVNATDSTGSGLYKRKWYTFTTMASSPPNPPTIDGPASGKAGVSYIYNFVAVDPDGDDVYYRIEWGDGSPVTEWIGPYHSGQLVIVSHTFSIRGTLIIKCQAKDSYDALSDWGQLKVTMPKVTGYIPSLFLELIERLMERFPHAFPILRQLLGY
jgi:hypothetical protein